jgi:putative transposase
MGPVVRLVDSHHVRISRIGEVKTYESTRKLYRHLERGTAKIVAATVKQRCGKWQVSFTVEVTRQVPATRPPGEDRRRGRRHRDPLHRGHP